MCHIFFTPGSDAYGDILVTALFLFPLLLVVSEYYRRQRNADIERYLFLALMVITFLLTIAVAPGVWL